MILSASAPGNKPTQRNASGITGIPNGSAAESKTLMVHVSPPLIMIEHIKSNKVAVYVAAFINRRLEDVSMLTITTRQAHFEHSFVVVATKP